MYIINKKMLNLTPFTTEKLHILDNCMPGYYNFVKQDTEITDNIITNKNHPKYECSNIRDKYIFFEKWLKSLLKKLKNTNPSIYFLCKWKYYSIVKLKNNEDIELFIKRMINKENEIVADHFLKNIGLSQIKIEGAKLRIDQFTDEEYYFPIIVENINNYQNIIDQREIIGNQEIVVNSYSIYCTGLRIYDFIFSIENLSIENLNIDNTNQNHEIKIIKKGINILKKYIQRTCKIRSTRNIHLL